MKDLLPSDVTDGRLADAVKGGGLASALGGTEIRSHVVGRRANVLVEAQSAREEFRAKVANLSPTDREKAFGTDDVDAICDEAVRATDAWYNQAMKNYKPIYSGPSGHTLGYLTLYNTRMTKPRHDDLPSNFVKPSLEEARLVMLASLIGNKEHHTYDEVMFASIGVGANEEGDAGLTYKHPGSYGDLTDFAAGGSSMADCIDNAIQRARDEVVAEYGDDQQFGDLVSRWREQVLSNQSTSSMSQTSHVTSGVEGCSLQSPEPSSSRPLPGGNAEQPSPTSNQAAPRRTDDDADERTGLLRQPDREQDAGEEDQGDAPTSMRLRDKLLIATGAVLGIGIIAGAVYYFTR